MTGHPVFSVDVGVQGSCQLIQRD